MSVWNTAGTGYQQTVRCVVRDDGFYTFDGRAFLLARLLRVAPGGCDLRVRDRVDRHLPWDNSSVNMTSLYMIYGAGFAY